MDYVILVAIVDALKNLLHAVARREVVKAKCQIKYLFLNPNMIKVARINDAITHLASASL